MFFPAPPEIDLWNSSAVVDTLSDLIILATITGYPEPNVEVRRDGVLIDQALEPRFESTFDDQSGRLTIRIYDVLKEDGGSYVVTASNINGHDTVMFQVTTLGERNSGYWNVARHDIMC